MEQFPLLVLVKMDSDSDRTYPDANDANSQSFVDRWNQPSETASQVDPSTLSDETMDVLSDIDSDNDEVPNPLNHSNLLNLPTEVQIRRR